MLSTGPSGAFFHGGKGSPTRPKAWTGGDFGPGDCISNDHLLTGSQPVEPWDNNGQVFRECARFQPGGS